MAKYKCVLVDQFETWLSVDKIYEADVVVSPPAFAGGFWLEVKRADDGFKAYCRTNQFVPVRDKLDTLEIQDFDPLTN